MIDLKTTTCNLSKDYNYRIESPALSMSANSTIHNDWYYRWLLFSHFQKQQDWQQTYQPMQLAAQDMTLVNEDCVCGLCGTIGPNVTHSPGTISRIGQALNISKYELPSSLTKLGRIEKAGLCNNCEHKVKILEDAANIRVNLTESLYSKEQHPTIPGKTVFKCDRIFFLIGLKCEVKICPTEDFIDCLFAVYIFIVLALEA